MGFFNDYYMYILMSQCVATIILFIMLIISFINNRKLRANYNNFFKHKTDETDLEELLVTYLEKVVDVNSDNELIKNDIDLIKDLINQETKRVNKRFETCIQKVDFLRYNPFPSVGGELSFVFTLLDENNDGIIFNSIFAEDGCYTYSKEIQKGSCAVKLSAEEEVSLKNAIEK